MLLQEVLLTIGCAGKANPKGRKVICSSIYFAIFHLSWCLVVVGTKHCGRPMCLRSSWCWCGRLLCVFVGLLRLQVWEECVGYRRLAEALELSGLACIPRFPYFVAAWLLWVASEELPPIAHCSLPISSLPSFATSATVAQSSAPSVRSLFGPHTALQVVPVGLRSPQSSLSSSSIASHPIPAITANSSSSSPALSVPAQHLLRLERLSPSASPGPIQSFALPSAAILSLSKPPASSSASERSTGHWLEADPAQLIPEVFAPLPARIANPAAAILALKICLQSLESLQLPAERNIGGSASLVLPASNTSLEYAASSEALTLKPSVSVSFALRVLSYVVNLASSSTLNQSVLGAHGILLELIACFRRWALTSLDSSLSSPATSSSHRQLCEQLLGAICLFLPYYSSASELHSLFSLLEAPFWPASPHSLATESAHSVCGSHAVVSLLTLALSRVIREPAFPFLMFDMARAQFASLEVSSLVNRSWPPSNGYSVNLWLYVEHWGSGATPLRLLRFVSEDSKSITDIYIHSVLVGDRARPGSPLPPSGAAVDVGGSALNTSQRAKRNCLVLQTSGKRPLTFDQFFFEERRWYMVSVSHSRSRLGNSVATLSVDGVSVQSGKLSYVAFPNCSVRAVMGTPYRFLNETHSGLRWRLASCLLVDDVLSEQSVHGLYQAGPQVVALVHGAGSKGATVFDLTGAFGELMRVGQVGAEFDLSPSCGDESTADPSIPITRREPRSPPPSSPSAADQKGPPLSHGTTPITSLLPFDSIVFFYHAANFASIHSMDLSSNDPDVPEHSLFRVLSSSGTVSNLQLLSSNVERGSEGSEGVPPADSNEDDVGERAVVLCCGQSSGTAAPMPAFLYGGCRVFRPTRLADSLRQIGGVRRLFPLVEHADSLPSLKAALGLISAVLYMNPKNLREMEETNGCVVLLSFLSSLVCWCLYVSLL